MKEANKMKPQHVFLSPHNDDLVLFASFAMQALAPDVLPLMIFESHVQGEGASIRKEEDRAALHELDIHYGAFLIGLSDEKEYIDGYIVQQIIDTLVELKVHRVASVWAPAIYENGHRQHNQIGRVAMMLGCPVVRFYHTYVREAEGKVDGLSASWYPRTEKCPVESKPVKLEHVTRKLRALACYRSQIETARFGCTPHFLRDQREWMVL